MRLNKLFLVGTLIWMGVIYFFSSQTATESSSLSLNISSDILTILNNLGMTAGNDLLKVENAGSFNGIIREVAHASVYFLLSVFVVNIFGTKKSTGATANTGTTPRTRTTARRLSPYIIAFLICAAYALSDEIHQLFVPGRAFELFDLMMDCIGILVGLCFVRGVSALRLRRIDV